MPLETTEQPIQLDQLPNYGSVEMSPQLLMQILTGFQFGEKSRRFQIIEDPVPPDAVYDHCEWTGPNRDSVRIYYRTASDGGQVSPTIQTQHDD